MAEASTRRQGPRAWAQREDLAKEGKETWFEPDFNFPPWDEDLRVVVCARMRPPDETQKERSGYQCCSDHRCASFGGWNGGRFRKKSQYR